MKLNKNIDSPTSYSYNLYRMWNTLKYIAKCSALGSLVGFALVSCIYAFAILISLIITAD